MAFQTSAHPTFEIQSTNKQQTYQHRQVQSCTRSSFLKAGVLPTEDLSSLLLTCHQLTFLPTPHLDYRHAQITNGLTPLQWAAELGHVSLAELAIERCRNRQAGTIQSNPALLGCLLQPIPPSSVSCSSTERVLARKTRIPGPRLTWLHHRERWKQPKRFWSLAQVLVMGWYPLHVVRPAGGVLNA